MRTSLALLVSGFLVASAAAPAAAQGDRQEFQGLRGVVRNISGDQMTVHTDRGNNVVVDTSQARKQSPDGIAVGDRVAAWGVFTASQRLQARVIREIAAGQAQKDKDGDWQHIHGRVESVEGETMRFRADSGRTLNIDLSDISPQIRQALERGEGVTVVGYEWLGPNRLRAEYVQQDSSDPSRGGRTSSQAPSQAPSASPSSASVDEKSWQRIHGKVESVSGSTLRFKTDDGRALMVDMSEVSPAVQKALTPGEGATVIGFFKGDANHVTAKFIQQDSSAR